MDAALRAIAEPNRRRILRLVRRRELPAGRIASRFPEISREAVSQHLRALREAGLLTERRDGTRRLYRARPEGLAKIQAFLDSFWGERMERLQEAAEGRAGGGGRRRAR